MDEVTERAPRVWRLSSFFSGSCVEVVYARMDDVAIISIVNIVIVFLV